MSRSPGFRLEFGGFMVRVYRVWGSLGFKVYSMGLGFRVCSLGLEFRVGST